MTLFLLGLILGVLAGFICEPSIARFIAKIAAWRQKQRRPPIEM
jgi:hypothetical protein